MKFLHEFTRYGDGELRDNGYWEIRGNLLVNRRGGHHYYNPKDDDETVEFDSWDDVLKLTIRKNDEVTGWIAPDGEFYGCEAQDHELLANLIFGIDERTLENRGYAKIYELPMDVIRMMIAEGCDVHRYEASRFGRDITCEQEKVLIDKGFRKSGIEWIM